MNPPKIGLIWLSSAAVITGCNSGASPNNECDIEVAARMQRIAEGTLVFREVHKSDPPVTVISSDGQPLHSWRILLTPYLQANTVYDAYQFDLAWNHEENLRLSEDNIRYFYTGSKSLSGTTSTRADIVRLVVENINESHRASLDIPEEFVCTGDGTDSMILLYINESPINWMEPTDVTLQEICSDVNGELVFSEKVICSVEVTEDRRILHRLHIDTLQLLAELFAAAHAKAANN